MCRRCGAPKPMVSSNNQASKVGDWICPNPMCKDLQFERNMVCRKCGTHRPPGIGQQRVSDLGKGFFTTVGVPALGIVNSYHATPQSAVGVGSGMGAVFAPEDWMCPSCGDHQFAKNAACRRCGAPKPHARVGNPVCKIGDWICPNPLCKDTQFERNIACRRCGTPKPVALGTAQMSPMYAGRADGGGQGISSAMAPEDWMCPNCGDHQFARNLACRKCGAPKPTISSNNQAAKMGDWICPNPACKDVQFEKNQTCRRCGTAKPIALQTLQMGGQVPPSLVHRGPLQGGPCAPTGALSATSMRMVRPGDWTCPNPSCKDIQFEKNQKCRLCGTPKPLVSSNRQIFKAGDWICPNPDCRDVQFERNAACRQCGTARPESAGQGEDAGWARSRSPAHGRGDSKEVDDEVEEAD